MEPRCRAVVATNLNKDRTEKRRREEVRSNLREALPIVRDLGLRWGAAIQVLEQLASLASAKGEATRAARWFGAAAALEQAFGSKLHFRKESFRFEERLSREDGCRDVHAGRRRRRRARLRRGTGGGTGLAGGSAAVGTPHLNCSKRMATATTVHHATACRQSGAITMLLMCLGSDAENLANQKLTSRPSGVAPI